MTVDKLNTTSPATLTSAPGGVPKELLPMGRVRVVSSSKVQGDFGSDALEKPPEVSSPRTACL